MNIPLFDAHCDTICEVRRHKLSLRERRLHIDPQRGAAYTPYAQVFAIFDRPWPNTVDWSKIDFFNDWPAEELTALCGELLNKLLSEFEKNDDILTLCLSTAQAKAAAEKGKVAAFIAVEGAELLGCSRQGLAAAYKKGVRLVNLCWNYDNALCGAANGAKKGGLSEKGVEFVGIMQEMGIAVDLSHASERTFWDTAEIAKRPIMAGHSNSKKVCNNPRNLTDEQFSAIVQLKGVAGLNMCPEFLNESKSACIEDVISHAEHFLELGGETALCLGGDLDGVDRLPKGMTGIESYGEIYEAMLRRNYKESLIQDIFYYNLFNALERML